MRKVVIGLIMCLLLVGVIGLVIAEQGDSNDSSDNNKSVIDNSTVNPGNNWTGNGGLNRERINEEIEKRIDKAEERLEKAEELINKKIEKVEERIEKIKDISGKEINITIARLENKKMILIAKRIEAQTDFNLTVDKLQNITFVKVRLRDGSDREIKVMPDVAAERAIERLRIRNCNESNNCTIILKEVGFGNGNLTRAVYVINSQENGRMFGIFKTRMKYEVEVDSESGNVTYAKMPWWGFVVVKSE